MNALIIDSSSSYRQMLAKLLESYSITTVAVNTVDDAAPAIQHQHFDIICITINLTGNDSLDFCREVRQHHSYKHIPIIMLTPAKEAETNKLALEAGVTDLFHKQDFSGFQLYIENMVERLNAENSNSGQILYIEDSASTAFLVTSTLEDNGYHVDHFLTAEEGMEAFNNNYYDLLLTDVVLTDLSGLVVVRAVRDSVSEDKKSTPIIAISSFNDNARKLELFSAGINDYVTKPVMNEELLARIGNLVQSRQLLTSLNNKQEQLERLALTDQLTSLYNRHYLMDMAPKRIQQAQRQKQFLCLMVIDIDFFKVINDTHGHSVGDTVLQAVAAQLVSGVRWEDIVARFGGEEFVVLLDHCSFQDAINIAEDLRQSIEKLKPAGIDVSASFGLATLKEDENDFASLFSRADEAVYEAKESGRNCVVFKQ